MGWFGVLDCNCKYSCTPPCEEIYNGQLYRIYNPGGFNPRDFNVNWIAYGVDTSVGTVDCTTFPMDTLVVNRGISLHGATLAQDVDNSSTNLKPQNWRMRTCVEVLDENNYLFGEMRIVPIFGTEFELGEVRDGVETYFGTTRNDNTSILHDPKVCYGGGKLIFNTTDTNNTDPIVPIVQVVESTGGTLSGISMNDWSEMPYSAAAEDSIRWTYHTNGLETTSDCPVCDE